jgi:hypothetical protein
MPSGIWTQYGATAVWSIPSDNPVTLCEDGVLLSDQASIGAVVASASSWYWASGILYVQASDSSDPNSSGKVYAPVTAPMVVRRAMVYVEPSVMADIEVE